MSIQTVTHVSTIPAQALKLIPRHEFKYEENSIKFIKTLFQREDAKTQRNKLFNKE